MAGSHSEFNSQQNTQTHTTKTGLGFFTSANIKPQEMLPKSTVFHYLSQASDAAKFYYDKFTVQLQKVALQTYHALPNGSSWTGWCYPELPRMTGNLFLGQLWNILQHGTGYVADKAAEVAGPYGLSYFWAKTSLFNSKVVVMLTEPYVIKQVLIDGVKHTAGYDTSGSFRSVIGWSILDYPVHDSRWFRERSKYNYLFHKNLIDFGLTEAVVEKYVEQYATDGNFFNIAQFATRVAMDVIGKGKLGFEKFDDATKDKIAKIIEKAMKVLSDPKKLLPFIGKLQGFFQKKVEEHPDEFSGKSLEELLEIGHKIILNILIENKDHILNTDNAISKTLEDEDIARRIQEHKIYQEQFQELKKSPELSLEEKIKLAEREKNGIFSKDIIQEVIQIFSLGHETTEKLITFAMLLLAEHPEVLEELHAKIDTPEGETLLHAIILEALRLYPPVPDMKDEIVDPATNEKKKTENSSYQNNKQKTKRLTINFGPGLNSTVTLNPGNFIVASPWVTHRLASVIQIPINLILNVG